MLLHTAARLENLAKFSLTTSCRCLKSFSHIIIRYILFVLRRRQHHKAGGSVNIRQTLPSNRQLIKPHNIKIKTWKKTKGKNDSKNGI